MISTTVSPLFGSSLVPQALLVARADLRIVDRLVVGEEHRDQAGVGGALYVVLAAQRMQSGARAADLAGDQRQRDQAARIVGAVSVLEMPMPQKMIADLARANLRATVRRTSASMPQIGAISSGV